mmetsp:Transcript_6670/g.10664  ORF Transcript_6670/g.10664 Transcript_6670/m.10664 type:complete len:468 (+) Transcript_6670:56-1459(+)
MSLTLDEAFERIDAEGTGKWTFLCTSILSLMSTALALESNISPYLAVCASDIGSNTSNEQAALNSVSGIGFMAGTALLLPLADSFGRWRTLYYSSLVAGFFAVVSAASMSYWNLFIARFLVSFFAATWLLAVDLLEEYVPPLKRGFLANMTNIGWGLGAVAINLLAWRIIPHGGWRLFAAVAAVPYVVISVSMRVYLVESPRWLLAKGKHDEALEALRYVATMNGCAAPCSQLQDPCSNENTQLIQSYTETTYWQTVSESFTVWSSLLDKKNIKITLAVWGIWICWNFAYNTIVIFDDVNFKGTSDLPCSFNYSMISGVSVSELIGPLLLMPLIDRSDLGWLGGRQGTQAISYVIAAVAALMTGMRVVPVFWWAFVTRGFIAAGSGASVLQIPELYDTQRRVTGSAAASFVGTLGSIISPYCVYGKSWLTSSSTLAFALVAATAMLLVLPETAQILLDKADVDKQSA